MQDRRKTRNPAAAAAAAEGSLHTDIPAATVAADQKNMSQPEADSAAAASVSPSRPRHYGGARTPNPAAWWSNSPITCCRGRECAGFCKQSEGGSRAARMSVFAVVRENLFCARCQNVFCSACKADHTKQACLSTPRGSITEEQLLAAVSIQRLAHYECCCGCGCCQ